MMKVFLLLAFAFSVLFNSLKAEAAEAAENLTLLTYNIHSGVPMGSSIAQYTATANDIRAIADVITSSAADIVALQEVRCDWAYGKSVHEAGIPPDMPRLLAAFYNCNFVFGSTLDDLPGFPPNTKYVEWGTFDKWTNNNAVHGEFGNAVLTRYPIVDAPETFPLPVGEKEEQRGCIRLVIENADAFGRIIVYATHLEHTKAEARERQIKAIIARAAAETTSSTIFVMGDFNYFPKQGETDLISLAKASGFHDLAAEYAEDHSQLPALTFPSDKPNRRIDYILCNRRLVVEESRTLPSNASDHLALAVRVSFKEKQLDQSNP